MRAVDKLLAAYFAFVSAVIVWRGPDQPADFWLLAMHVLFWVLIFLFTRLKPEHTVGNVLHDLYPLIMLLPFYAEIGVLNEQLGRHVAFENDAIIQRWEAAIFGGQISYDWIRKQPSVLWSGIFHLAYFAYYPIVLLAPILLTTRRRREATRAVLLATMVAFVTCYVVFILFPVAGPYYAFEQPTGPVRDVWPARIVYDTLAQGSSFGAAFPSSHVGATVAATLATWRHWRPLGWTFVIPCALMTVGTVYCQMHYGMDAGAGLIVGGTAAAVSAWIPNQSRADSPRSASAPAEAG